MKFPSIWRSLFCKKRRIVPAVAAASAIALFLSGCMMPLLPYRQENAGPAYHPAPTLSGLTASEDAVVAGRRCQLLFTVAASDVSSQVMLCWGEQQITPMNDDGQNGDFAAGDGIYSAAVFVEADQQDETLPLYAQTGSVVSETVEIRVFSMPTEEEAEQTAQLLSTLENMQLQFSSPAGFVPEEQTDALLDQAEALALEGQSQGTVAQVVRQEDALEIWLSSGVAIMFVPETQHYLGGAKGQTTLVTMEPFHSEFLEMGKSYENCVDNTAAAIAEALGEYRFEDSFNYDEEEVTLEAVSHLGENQVILWYGHGGFNSKYHSYLTTGEAFDPDAFHHDSEYYEKYVQGYFMVSDGQLAITSKYVDRYCGAMDGSLVFLTACKSGQSDRLANAFLNKGAVAVLGYDNSVFASYGARMLQSVMGHMLSWDASTGSYLTLGQALQLAQAEYGKTDAEFYDKAQAGAELLIFGGEAAEGYRLSDEAAPQPTPSPTAAPAPSPAATSAPSAPSRDEVYQAYGQFLQGYEWIAYCPSDLSEIPPEEYERYWLGTYALLDIDQNGVDELVIKAGQSVADTSHTFFTYQGGKVQYVGSLFCGDGSIYQSVSGSGAVICERHGGLGQDTYLELTGNTIAVTHTEEYNYESPDYVDSKVGVWEPAASYSVHDFTPLA